MEAQTLPIRSAALEAEVAAIPQDLRADARSEAWVAHCEGGDSRAVIRAVHRFRKESVRRRARVFPSFRLDGITPSRIRLVI